MLNIQSFEAALKTGEILSGQVNLFDPEKGLILHMKENVVLIPMDEVEFFKEKPNYRFLVGTKVYFVVTEIQNNVIIASRKKAQEILKPIIIEKLNNGETLKGRISNLKKYGAFVDIKGVSGLLKNYDFTDDPNLIKDIKKVGDIVDVTLKRISDDGDIHFFVPEKYTSPCAMKFEDFKKEQVVLGVITAMKPTGCFVRIGTRLDALCPPPEFEVSEDDKVQVYINRIQEEEKKIAGKIITRIDQ